MFKQIWVKHARIEAISIVKWCMMMLLVVMFLNLRF